MRGADVYFAQCLFAATPLFRHAIRAAMPSTAYYAAMLLLLVSLLYCFARRCCRHARDYAFADDMMPWRVDALACRRRYARYVMPPVFAADVSPRRYARPCRCFDYFSDAAFAITPYAATLFSPR